MQAEPYLLGTGYHHFNPNRNNMAYIQRYSCQRKAPLAYPQCESMPSISPVHEVVESGTNLDLMSWNNAASKYGSESEYKPLHLGGFVNHLLGSAESLMPPDLENGDPEYNTDCGYPTSMASSSWENEHPRNWSCSQVIDWLYYAVFVKDYESALIENFRGISGKELIQFKKYDFVQLLRSESYADRAYSHLQQILYQCEYLSNNTSNLQSAMNTLAITNSYDTNNTAYPSYINDMYTDLEQSSRTYNPNVCQYNSADTWYNTSRSDVESDGECNRSPYTSSPYPDIISKHAVDEDPRKPPKRGPGRPAGRESKKKKTGQRSSRLWEFIRDLLKDKDTCPRLVKWEDRDEGVFRFVQSDQVAKLWGERKSNPRMTYEKLSRAMRYYYKSKVLQPVLGRRLVYKFGPTATGWRPHET